MTMLSLIAQPLLAPIGLLAEINRLVYAPPLLLAVSLVYAGTRHEDLQSILRHTASFGGWTVVFMASVAAAIEALAFFQ